MEKLGPYVVHPAATAFPLVTGDAFEELVSDIKTNGLRIPIAVDHEELMIIDGRNRYRACEAAGITPKFQRLPEYYDDLDFIYYISSLNKHRRHLNAGQLGMIAVEMMPKIEAAVEKRNERRKQAALNPDKLREPDSTGLNRSPADDLVGKRSAEVAAQIVGTSAATVKRAKKVKKVSKRLASKVASGELSLNNAYAQVQNPTKIKIDPKIQEASELVKIEQETRPVIPTGIIAAIAQLNTTVDEIARQAERKGRWPEEFRRDIPESLRRHIRQVDLLVAHIEGDDDFDVSELLGEDNA